MLNSPNVHGLSCECLSRRSALQMFAGVAGAGLLMPSLSFASGSAAAIVLTCMDYRLVDDHTNYFNERGMKNKYDHVVLASGTIGRKSPPRQSHTTELGESAPSSSRLDSLMP